jgi:ribosomal protein S18 acetylase RimI-like enzyme
MQSQEAPAVNVRAATLADLPALRALYAEFHEFHVTGVPEYVRSPKSGEIDPPDFEHRVEEIVLDDDSTILVADENHEIVGMAEAYARDITGPLRHAKRYGFLQSLAIRELQRRRGVGSELLRAAEAWARDRGATEMRLETWEFAEGPLGFYERAGYRTLKRTLVRPLTD